MDNAIRALQTQGKTLPMVDGTDWGTTPMVEAAADLGKSKKER